MNNPASKSSATTTSASSTELSDNDLDLVAGGVIKRLCTGQGGAVYYRDTNSGKIYVEDPATGTSHQL